MSLISLGLWRTREIHKLRKNSNYEYLCVQTTSKNASILYESKKFCHLFSIYNL